MAIQPGLCRHWKSIPWQFKGKQRFPIIRNRGRCAVCSSLFFAALLLGIITAFCFSSQQLFAQGTNVNQSIAPNKGESILRVLHSENGARLTLQKQVQHPIGDPPNRQNVHYEQLVFDLPPESCIVLGHFLGGFPLVIDALSSTIRVRANQQGIVLGAQIVMPYTVDSQTGKPITFLVTGTPYSGSGNWEFLGFYDKTGQYTLAKQVDQTAKRLRANLG